MQSRCKRSELELRGSRNGLKIAPASSRGVHSAQHVAQIPNPPTKTGIEGSDVAKFANSYAPIRNPPIHSQRNP
eukprot:6401125-Alexandrium_andersonii.AAC.1